MSEQTLNQKLDVFFSDFVKGEKDIPAFIGDNLAKAINLRPYQNKALKHFLRFVEDYDQRPRPSHLLFHMATGSGKTVLMASLILYLYEKGYRNFLFFVNSTNIIEKTRKNFLSPGSAKYLFAEQLMLDDKNITIRMVANFDEAVDTDINIHFSTVQGLHARINRPRENAITLEDFEGRKIVMISDEAHHLNTMTKGGNLNASEKEEKKSWEKTVERIFKLNLDNLLLEFTATAELNHPAIHEKYRDKIVFDYSLRKFREDGYSKDVELLKADLPPVERMFQAVILSQYRRKIAEQHGVHIKPVILMKSKLINESNKNEKLFNDYLQNLEQKSFRKLRQNTDSKTIIFKALEYFFEERNISYENFIQELRRDFSPEKIINVNSQSELQEQQDLLNSLEGYNNEIRVVFAVDKLNEGWDVLNLFDIVRLYNPRSGKSNKSKKTTVAEAQLIGRGARYCPFDPPDQSGTPKDMRKYDQRMDHDLRILEELHYHSAHNPQYIEEIKTVLSQMGIISNQPCRATLKVKDDFKNSTFYQNQNIYLNERIRNKREDIFGLLSYQESNLFIYPRHLMTGRVEEEGAFRKDIPSVDQSGELKMKKFSLASFGQPILRRAIDMVGFFEFESIKRKFPTLKGMKGFMSLDAFLGSVKVEVTGLPEHLNFLSAEKKLDITLYVLKEIERAIRAKSFDHKGTKQFDPKPIKDIIGDYTISIDKNEESGRPFNESKEIAGLERINLFEKKWHIYDNAYGNSYEKAFIQYINQISDQILEKFDEFYLVRNEKHFEIYNFSDGKPFEPDFVLFLKEKQKAESLIYQLFVEPKGEHLEKEEKWKKDFLLSLKQEAKLVEVFDGPKYRIMGMPFFQREGQGRAEFSEALEAFLKGAS